MVKICEGAETATRQNAWEKLHACPSRKARRSLARKGHPLAFDLQSCLLRGRTHESAALQAVFSISTCPCIPIRRAVSASGENCFRNRRGQRRWNGALVSWNSIRGSARGRSALEGSSASGEVGRRSQ